MQGRHGVSYDINLFVLLSSSVVLNAFNVSVYVYDPSRALITTKTDYKLVKG